MDSAFIRYIKCVGTGARHNRDLSREEMQDAMARMLDGRASPEQISAFLLGWRLKPETTEEFLGAIDAIDAVTKKSPVENGIELGYPFDGKADNPYIFPLAAEALRPFGLDVVVSGGALQPAKGGVTVREVCRALPMPENLHCFDREDYCKPLADLSPVRMKLGIRTGLNTVERLPDVGACGTALIGVFHKPYVKKYAEIFGERYRRLLVVKGNEGTPEIFGKCRVWVCEAGEIAEQVVDPARFGIDYRKSFDPIGKEESLRMLREPSDALIQIARLNAALWLFAKGVAASLEEGWEMLHG